MISVHESGKLSLEQVQDFLLATQENLVPASGYGGRPRASIRRASGFVQTPKRPQIMIVPRLSAIRKLTHYSRFAKLKAARTYLVSSSIKTWVEEIRSGNLRALSRAITAVENRTRDSHELLKALFAYSGRARVIGLTGSPGAGKSTLVDALAAQYRKRRQSVGIIAIDPTSPFTGGAILGDRIRMSSHSGDDGTFIRSMATRGSLGGLSSTTADVATVMDASGRDLVLIETVGVGQDEVDIVRLADVTIVILVPGMGDDVQSLKAGIMEIADIFVINKADREGAERLEREVKAMQSLSMRNDSWAPPVIKTVATSGAGVAELAASIDEYEGFLAKSEVGQQRRIANWRNRLRAMLRDEVLRRIEQEAFTEEAVSQYAAEVAGHERDPYSLIDEIVGKLMRREPPC